jgi:TonB family protein
MKLIPALFATATLTFCLPLSAGQSGEPSERDDAQKSSRPNQCVITGVKEQYGLYILQAACHLPPTHGPTIDFDSFNNAVLPEKIKRERINGVVRLKLDIDARGVLTNAVVEKSSGSDELDQAALNQAKQWRYGAATVDRRPCPSEMHFPLAYTWKS